MEISNHPILTVRMKDGSVFVGRLLQSWDFDHHGTFRLAVGDTLAERSLRKCGFTERVIPWEEVESHEDFTGETLQPPLVPKISVERKEFKIASSRTGEEYTVRELDGAWSCTCKGYQFRRYCKHIKECQSGRV